MQVGENLTNGMESAELAPAGEWERTFDTWGVCYSGSKLGELHTRRQNKAPGFTDLRNGSTCAIS